MSAFYQALNEPKNNNTKHTYEIWRREVGEHRPYIDANKVANVRRDIMNKKRLKFRLRLKILRNSKKINKGRKTKT